MPKPKIKFKNFLLRGSLALAVLAAAAFVCGSPAFAMTEAGPSDSTSGGGSSSGSSSTSKPCDGNPSTASCQIDLGSANGNCKDTETNKEVDNSKVQDCVKSDPIIVKVNQIVDVLSALVGIVVIAVIIAGGIQYSIAGGSSEAVSKAKDRMMNGFIALVVYMFAFAILQWLLPGGINPWSS